MADKECDWNRDDGEDRLDRHRRGERSNEKSKPEMHHHGDHISKGDRKHHHHNKEHTLKTSEELVQGTKGAGTTYGTPALGLLALGDEVARGTGGEETDTIEVARGTGDEETDTTRIEVSSIPDELEETSVADVEAQLNDETLPVAETVAPPPELLEHLRKLEEAQLNMPRATPLDMDEERKKLRKQRLVVAGCVVIVTAIVAVVLGVVLGMRDGDDTQPTESPTFTLLKDMVTGVWPYSDNELADTSSPQYRALTWLEGNANLYDYPEWKRLQRYVLAVFYYSTNGDGWDRSDRWMSDDEECTWISGAVDPVCNDETEFLRLVTPKNGLIGTLPVELGGLSDSLGK